MDETGEAEQQPADITGTPGPPRQQDVSGPNQVVQFDLVQPMSEVQLKNTHYGRRKPVNDLVPNVKEALKWIQPNDNEPEFGRTRKRGYDQVQQIAMERSPQRWKTMYKDQFRKFCDSPKRGVSNEEFPPEEQLFYENGEPVPPEIAQEIREQ